MHDKSNEQQAFIRKMVELRQSRNMTQQQLSAASGVKQPMIARLETGKSDPQLSTILKLLACMDAKLELRSERKDHDD